MTHLTFNQLVEAQQIFDEAYPKLRKHSAYLHYLSESKYREFCQLTDWEAGDLGNAIDYAFIIEDVNTLSLNDKRACLSLINHQHPIFQYTDTAYSDKAYLDIIRGESVKKLEKLQALKSENATLETAWQFDFQIADVQCVLMKTLSLLSFLEKSPSSQIDAVFIMECFSTLKKIAERTEDK